ncbi:glycoside hydrolase family 61 protein [Serendipita vermifera MAFF 305830]|uniref:lytic cellulose monooxygenase (C4-dehydrogenating) n=1 Tax=Serendipita vermifera MAFF 305830 TaxID=933852 RepID=A0A0C2WRY4_SERVB|nr:glycoside hydrolase family 61 protein [Serendipita vermifera MAFF 305830]
MKLFSALVCVVLTAQEVFAHYRFLGINGSGDYQQYDNYYSNGPVTNVASSDIACNLGAIARTTGTLTVAAGSTATFNVPNGISHPGPLLWYMAKAPGSVNGWNPSGNVWFKIAQTGATFSGGAMSWPSSGLSTVSVRIPSSISAGEYLLRVEHIAVHGVQVVSKGFYLIVVYSNYVLRFLHIANSLGAQFYISCAQLKVTGGGSASPSPLVAFPGAYKATDPGILINIYYPVPTSYTPPGPAVWSG